MKRFGVWFLVVAYLVFISCAGENREPVAGLATQEFRSANPADYAPSIPAGRLTQDTLPVIYLDGRDFFAKNPASQVNPENELNLSLIPEAAGTAFVIYQLIPGEELIDHLVVGTGGEPGAGEVYCLVANYLTGSWEEVAAVRDAQEPATLVIDIADWLACESTFGEVYVALVCHVDPVVTAPGAVVEVIQYIKMVTLKDQALDYLDQTITAEEDYFTESSKTDWLRHYADRRELFLYGPTAVRDPLLGDGVLPHDVHLQIINPGYQTYSAVVAFPYRNGTWGVWTRCPEGEVILEANPYGWREAVAIDVLRQIYRAELAFYAANNRYAILMELDQPPVGQFPYVDPYLASGCIEGDVYMAIDLVGEGFKGWAFQPDVFRYEVCEDGVVIKVE